MRSATVRTDGRLWPREEVAIRVLRPALDAGGA